MASMPGVQRALRIVSCTLVGIIALGALLDAVSNATAIVTPIVSVIGTIVIAATWLAAQMWMRSSRATWLTADASHVKLRSLGRGTTAAVIGAVALLWLPRALDANRNQLMTAHVPAADAGNSAAQLRVPTEASAVEVASAPVPSGKAQAQSAQAPSITAFRVLKQTASSVTLEVDYVYDAVYQDRVFIGACLYRNGVKIGDIRPEYGGFCGYYPGDGSAPSGQVPSIGAGTARVTIKPFLNGPVVSDEVEIFLNRWGYGATTIVSRRFPFIHSWTPQ